MIKLTLALLLTLNTSCFNSQIPVNQISIINGMVTSNINNSVQIETTDGNGWYLENRSDLKVNENYTIVFNNMGTVSIYDDEIINVVEQE